MEEDRLLEFLCEQVNKAQYELQLAENRYRVVYRTREYYLNELRNEDV